MPIGWASGAGQHWSIVVDRERQHESTVAQLDANQFAHAHRSVVVNLRVISHVTRGDNEIANIHLKNRADLLTAHNEIAAPTRLVPGTLTGAPTNGHSSPAGLGRYLPFPTRDKPA